MEGREANGVAADAIQALVANLQGGLRRAELPSSINLVLQLSSGPAMAIVPGGLPVSPATPAGPAEGPSVIVPVPATLLQNARILIHGDGPITLVHALVTAELGRLESQQREEELLEELGASWESLEALYEISTDVQHNGDITESLKRLMERLSSRQEGLGAAVILAHEDRIEPLVSTAGACEAVARSMLGDLERAITERQLIVFNDWSSSVSSTDKKMCWSGAASVAAAPIVSRETSIGLVVVWRENRDFPIDSQLTRMLEAIAYQTSILMESDRLNRQLRESELLAQEVQIASSIQELLLFGNSPQAHPEVEIAAFSSPSQQIDGDFYDFFQHPDGSLDVVIGDVMGKGVGAALVGAATKNQMLRAMADLAIGRHRGLPAPAAVMNRVAANMAEQLINLERFVTICYARFDFHRRSLTLVDCGHTGAIRRRGREPHCSFLRGDDLPLGVQSHAKFEEVMSEMRAGDTYLFYSDGITENRSPYGELYGEDRLAEIVESWCSLGPDVLVEQIRREAVAFRGSDQFSDDFTCVVVRVRLAKASEPVSPSRRREFRGELSELPQVCSWLRESEDVADDEVYSRIEVSCSELFVNYVRGGMGVKGGAPVIVEANSFEGYLTVSIRHKHGDFNLQCVGAPALDGSPLTTITPFVRRSADEITYSRDRNGASVVTLSFARNSVVSQERLHAALH